METPKQTSNTTIVIIIALALIIIVALVCAMGVWMVQRTMAFNEKLLDARLAQQVQPQRIVEKEVVTPVQQTLSTPPRTTTPQIPKVKTTTLPLKTPPKVQAPATQPVAQQPVAKVAPQTPAPKKIKAPTEKPDVPLGFDGLPLNRVTLPVGNDDIEWQF